jgi:hypothetical protein
LLTILNQYLVVESEVNSLNTSIVFTGKMCCGMNRILLLLVAELPCPFFGSISNNKIHLRNSKEFACVSSSICPLPRAALGWIADRWNPPLARILLLVGSPTKADAHPRRIERGAAAVKAQIILRWLGKLGRLDSK